MSTMAIYLQGCEVPLLLNMGSYDVRYMCTLFFICLALLERLDLVAQCSSPPPSPLFTWTAAETLKSIKVRHAALIGRHADEEVLRITNQKA